jgi:hypothetical protein
VRTKRQHREKLQFLRRARTSAWTANWTEIIDDAIRTTPIFCFILASVSPARK